ncbi:ABC transporter permease [Kineococcus sp. SYSU DK003]|uniref:ABC transporter permease n=1 Tax=Kineococcus sp. SYSU DK003 TaxID=3383124 RepID=UPI003D7D0043
MNRFYRENRWWILRTLALPLHIAIFATLAFFLVRVVPGDPVAVTLEAANGYTQEQYDQAAEAMGLGGSIWNQLATFWAGFVRGDLGTSIISGRPVLSDILDRLPGTLELVLVGLVGAALLSLVLGFVLLTVPNRLVQRVVRAYSHTAGAVPPFALAVVGIFVFFVLLKWLPSPLGRTGGGVELPVWSGFPILDAVATGSWAALWQIVLHYVLPIAVIVVCYTPYIFGQLVVGLDDAAKSAATLFRIASGANRWAVYRSIFRRAVSSAVVMFAGLLGGLIGGVVVLEQLFSFGGVGQFAVDAVNTSDFVALQGFLIVIAGICLVIFLVVDVVNMLLDPRRRPGEAVSQ